MKIYLAADHGGFKLKEEIKLWLKEWGFSAQGGSALGGEYEDMGAKNYIPEDDYSDYAWPAALKVGSDQGALGIFVCRSGQGECIVANKARHVRAAIAWNEKSAYAARNDDNANVLCLPSDYVSLEDAKKIVYTFLTTKFDFKHERYARRLDKVNKIDINL